MYCPYCGAPNAGDAQVCINCKRPLVPVAAGVQYYNSAPVYPPQYVVLPGLPGQLASFWARFGAWLIDSLIIGLLTALSFGIPLAVWFGSFWQKQGTDIISICNADSSTDGTICEDRIIQALNGESVNLAPIIIGASIMALVLYLVYYVGLTASGSTLGKKLFGLKVVKADGSAPGFIIALLRQTVGYWLSGLFFALGFIWAGFDDRKQAWHDKLVQTYVVKS